MLTIFPRNKLCLPILRSFRSKPLIFYSKTLRSIHIPHYRYIYNTKLSWEQQNKKSVQNEIKEKFPILQKSNISQLHDGNLIHKEKQLSTKMFTIPNIITMTRIACTPFIGYFIVANNLTTAILFFSYSCITDFLDGYIARTYNLNSIAGTILDPIADKLLMVVTTIALSLPPGPQLVPLGIAGLILGRDIMLGLSGFVLRFVSMKQRYGSVSWRSYWDLFNFPSVVVKPTVISKWNTFLQMIYLGTGVLILLVDHLKDNKENMDDDYENGQAKSKNTLKDGFKWMGYIVGTTTILSGGSYLFSTKAVKFLPKVR
ncbi:cardiolipin synthase NDAI_0A02850 [Naumovozyma dairenensis CBS 421]|uniref:CDP-diacylglycerol--glycerol-3-phosphate 3-phosphatidyltransferase n=1 Tax=Naumovozyma dairenensis (strain ATCC 10597 / BCRC 20456 / CBS 421 / NBRC 0211 / NRRL Y-12639) TaxID=1071378 RepID=G0W3Q4_NAUDC|nr:hypothetical protein NDAI_0A02850 [Naumovozyma dairenensis CBS 421]CCD22442.1 hypothetical protein NDAI_0A02850 [Naumovozyma dairenensis CBS 421]